MFKTTPTALINTTSEVLPAETNGKGSPVGGIEPVMACYCTEIFVKSFPIIVGLNPINSSFSILLGISFTK